MRTLHLHIGTPKTATSTLQRFCLDNREALSQMGCAFPVMPFRFERVGTCRNANFLIGSGRVFAVGEPGNPNPRITEPGPGAQTAVPPCPPRNLAPLDARLAHLAEREPGHAGRIELSPGDDAAIAVGLETVADSFACHDAVILSEEVLWLALAAGNDSFLDALVCHAHQHAYRIHAVVYLRRQDDYAASSYNQNIKAGDPILGSMTFREWLADNAVQFDYHAVLERLAAKIGGRGNVTVRVWDRRRLSAIPGGVVADFLSAVGLPADAALTFVSHDVNTTSLTPGVLAAKRLANASPYWGPSCEALFRRAAERVSTESPAGPARAADLLDTDALEEWLSSFADGNTQIARDFLASDSPLFDTAPPLPAQGLPPEGGVEAEMRRFFRRVVRLQDRRLAKEDAVRGFAPVCAPSTRVSAAIELPDLPLDELADWCCERQVTLFH